MDLLATISTASERPTSHPPSPSPLTPEDDLKSSILQITSAINTRNFNPSSKIWRTTMTPTTICEPTFTAWPTNCLLPEFLARFDSYTTRHPEHFLRVVDMHVTVRETARVPRGGDRANVFVTFVSNGIPVGVVRESVGSFDFVWVRERWLCERYRCLPGMATVEAFTS